jgi:putative ABC transport system permease protein
VVGILVGARASAQHREIGLLKAAGFTPRQVGAVFALESAALGFIAAALGFTLGVLLAPRLAAPSAETLLGSPTIAANPWHILVASCLVIPVLLAGTLTSTRRSTRYTVLEAIRAGRSSPPNSRLARTTSTVPIGIRASDPPRCEDGILGRALASPRPASRRG